MNTSIRPWFAPVLMLAMWFPGTALAKEAPDHWNLGSVGVSIDLVKDRVVVTAVHEDTPAEGKLEKGDVIVGMGDSELGKDPIDSLGRALDAAEKSGSCVLKIERAGTTKEVKLKLPKLGAYTGAFSAKNSKVKKHLKAACEYVIDQQQGGGVWHKYRDGKPHRGDGITTATVMSALGLMAVDAKKYKKAIKAATSFAMTQVRPDEMGPNATSGLHRNWPVALTALFLAERYGQAGDKVVRKRLVAMLDRLAKNQEPTGGWSHFPGFSEGPSYKSLSSLTALALIAQGVAVKTGIDVHAESIKKGLDYLEACIDDSGAMAYSKVNGATGPQCTGRAFGAMAAFLMHGRESEATKRLQKYVLAHIPDLLESHPAPLMAVLFGSVLAGQWQKSPDKALAGFGDQLRDALIPFVTLARHPEGYFMAQPSPETRRVSTSQGKPNADRSVHDPYWSNAIIVMLLASTSPKLICLGAKAKRR